MIFTSPIIEAGSGSVAGLTFSRNKGGNYIRGRAIPTNPNSPLQQAVRGFMSQLTSLWSNTLTVPQRAGWDTYAENVPVLNSLGQSIFLQGLNHYVRSNIPRLQAAATRIDDAPTIFNLGDFTPVSFAVDTAADELDVTFTDTDDWANEDDAHMFVWGSQPQGPTTNFFKGPYRFLDSIDGDGTTAPTSPAAIALLQAIVAGQRSFARVRVSRADGRLSADFRGFGDAP